MSFLSIIHPDDRPRCEALVGQMAKGEIDSFVIEKRYIRKSGDPVWVWTSVSLVPGSSEEPPYLIAVTTDITQQKNAEGKLRESETLLRIASRVARLGGWAVELPSQRIFWSDEVCALLEVPVGTSPTLEEALNFYPLEWREKLSAAFEECTRDGTPFDLELETITATGRRQWVQCIGEAVRDTDGTIILVHGAFQDIGEKKQNEARVRELATRLTNTLESITDAFFTLDHEWRFTYINQEGERLLLRSRAELLGRGIWDEFAPAVGSMSYHEYQRAVHENRSVAFEEYYPPLDKWFDVRAFPSKDGLSVYFRDVTDVRAAREALRTSEERFQIVTRATNDAIYDLDMVNNRVWWNEGVETLFGYARAEQAAASDIWTKHIHPDDRERVVRTSEASIAKGVNTWAEEYRFIRKDGSTAYVLDRGFLIRDGEGRPVRMVGSIVDLTQQKNLEAQILRAQRLESIGTLAGGIAHDLNNMLAPIVMSLGMLKQQTRTPNELRLLNILESSAQKGAAMVHQVLTFARGMDGERTIVQVDAVISDLSRLIRDTFDRNIRVRTETLSHLWPVLGDPTQIHQLLLNLCVNARDAMPKGGDLYLSAANVTLDAQSANLYPGAKAGKYVIIKVIDTGIGIPATIRDRIFDPFFTTKEVGKGTGLGLATVQAIVKRHDGFMNVASVVGRGTEFEIYIPAFAGEPDAIAATAPEELPYGQGEMVLVVDDEEPVRLVTQQILEAFGYQVLLAENGAEAIAVYEQHRAEIDVVLTDIMMPVMDGIAAIRSLRKINSAVKIIATSGLADDSMIAKVINVGVMHFLPKPYTTDALLQTLTEILERVGDGVSS